MITSFALICRSIASIECTAGILGNGIILAATSLSCIGSKTWPPYDMIMISLSSSRFILQLMSILDFLLRLFYEPFYYKENVFVVSKIIFTFLNCSSLWIGACLSVFYCIKVASFRQSFFTWLKLRIARLVPWMLLTSWLCSFTAAVPFAWHVYSVHENITTPLPTTNSSAMRTTRKNRLSSVIYLWNAITALPLLLSVVSSILLIQSLWVHIGQMQNNASGFRDPSSQAHISAIKSVCSFFIFSFTYFIGLLLLYSTIFSHFSGGESMCILIMSACPTGHTMVLIWSNPKFRELPARIWHHTNCPVRTTTM